MLYLPSHMLILRKASLARRSMQPGVEREKGAGPCLEGGEGGTQYHHLVAQ